MSDNAESGIAAVQAKAAQTDGLQKYHRSTIGYLNERILTFVFMIVLIGLVFVWVTSSSPYITYGSLVGVILLTLLWGMLRIKRIHRVREKRALQVKEMH